jgi:hypothetical protein
MFKKLALAVIVALVFTGCKANFQLIDHVSFLPSDNLEVVRVSLVFTNNIKSDLAGGFTLKDYGFLFINPYTPSEPFEVGFSLNTKIVNDQDYIKLAPTEVLPNGVSIGLDYALVEIHAPQPISSKFDIYGYVDVLHTAWLGAAGIFTFINDQYFPNDLSISQVFLRDTQGKPGVMASVFGPSANADGSVKRAGGIAVFANVRQLLDHHAMGRGAQALTLRPEPIPFVAGPRAREYNGNYKKLRMIESNLVRAMNLK